MKCFYHHDRDAVGSCKSCQRGLCSDCAVDFPQGLACPSRCEADVKDLITLIQNNVKLSSTSTSLVGGVRRGGVIGAGFNLVLGVLFVMWGLPAQAWERFGLWLVVGLVLYFSYGYWRSRLRTE